MKIDKLIIVVSRNGREERLEVTGIDHDSPDVKTLIRAASSTSATMTLTVDAGDNEVAAALGRLRWGSPVGKTVEEQGDAGQISTVLNQKIESMDFSARAMNALTNYDRFTYFWQVVEKTEADLLLIKNLGVKMLAEIKGVLAEYGFQLGMKFSDEVRSQLLGPE